MIVHMLSVYDAGDLLVQELYVNRTPAMKRAEAMWDERHHEIYRTYYEYRRAMDPKTKMPAAPDKLQWVITEKMTFTTNDLFSYQIRAIEVNTE